MRLPVADPAEAPSRYSTGEKDGAANPNLVQNPDFLTDTVWIKGTGWTIAGGKATRTVVAASSLSQAGIIANPSRNILVTDYVVRAGSFAPKLGTVVGSAITVGSGIDAQLILADGVDLSFDADAAFDGDIINSSVIKVAEASAVIKTAYGNLYALSGYNGSNETRYIMLFDTASEPSDNDVPFAIIPVGTDDKYEMDLSVFGTHFKNGLAISNSTTPEFLTKGSAEITIVASYK